MDKGMLRDKIKNRTMKVGVVGLGYVGLPLAVEKARAGYKTIGFDVQAEKVEMVNKGKNYIGDVVNQDLEEINGSISGYLFFDGVDYHTGFSKTARCIKSHGRTKS